MASIIREKKKGGFYYRICFIAPNGKRPSLHLGKVSKSDAQDVKTQVERIIKAKKLGLQAGPEVEKWLASVNREMLEKLAALDLIPPVPETDQEPSHLPTFLDGYLKGRTDARPRTRENLGYTIAALKEFFVSKYGRQVDLKHITAGDADEWKQWLAKRYSTATISRNIKAARQFFKRAIRHGMIESNPFGDIKAGTQINEKRLVFVERDLINKVLDKCQSVEMRLLIVLCRYLGTRSPSETVLLRWSDIDWQAGRIQVTSPKTERAGKPHRSVPLFPEVREELEKARKLLPEGYAGAVLPFLGSPEKNARTRMMKLLKRAGVEPWPRIFQNLRASRIMELLDEFPQKVVSEWCGHTEDVSRAHYQKARQEHYDRATAMPSEKAAYIPAYPDVEVRSTCSLVAESESANASEKAMLATYCYTCTSESIPPRGFRSINVSAYGVTNFTKLLNQGGVKSGVVFCEVIPSASDPAEVARVWLAMTTAEQRAIKKIARGCRERLRAKDRPSTPSSDPR